jgi:crotonobetainyl-CoA:carnitine CoA-transferase CaiB-like acyl-CoA transferase
MFLKPYRVLDLTGPLGFLCGKILGDLGGDVIKIEPPGGDGSRRVRGLTPSLAGHRQRLRWLALNANKRGITLNLQDPAGRQLFLRLLAKADFVLESFSPGTLHRWRLGYPQLREQNPGLILVSITPYGQAGPYHTFQGSDLEIMALSGAMSLAGEKDGEPMRVSAPQAAMWVGAEATMGALTALAYRSMSGQGQHVDVSAQVAVMAAIAHAPAFWDLNRINPERAGIYVTGRSLKGARMRVFWPCKDGWINFILYGGAAGRHANQQLVDWMDEKKMAPEWFKQTVWSKVDMTTIAQSEVDALELPIGQFLASLTKREFFEGAVQREILGYPVFTVEDIYADPQLSARQFWQEINDPQLGMSLKYPGGFALFNGQRPAIRRTAPCVGEHNREIFTEELGLTETEIEQLESSGVI